MKLILSSGQFKLLATFCREVSQMAIIGAFGSWLLPGAFGLETRISLTTFVSLLVAGLTLLWVGVILEKEGGE